MRAARTIAIAPTATLLVALSMALPAAAQNDINPPLPNVLLLVDTSGSMEYMLDGSLPATCLPTGASDLNRWTSLVEVLTGTVQGRGCLAVDRDSSDFAAEFSLSGVPPYDASYHIPHHRIVSNGCVAGAGTLPATPFEWPADAIGYHEFSSLTTACTNSFSQDTDGLMDVFRDRVRFGLMTFDNRPDEGDGVNGGAADYFDGVQGHWSYFFNWQLSSAGPNDCQAVAPPPSGFCGGFPPLCSTTFHVELGARNAAAPPWEGRMVGFGPWDAAQTDVYRQNDHIQEALLTVRPYGGTPLGALLTDALVYLRYDDDDDPDPYYAGRKFGPKNDAYVINGCRNTSVIVLSDGEPNLELRPDCAAAGGQCPYLEAHEVAAELFNGSPSVKVHAIGFALESGTGFDCSTLSIPADLGAGGQCDGATGGLKACCNMARIAFEGGSGNAIFANNQADLKSAFSGILADVAAGATSRTMPVFVSALNSQAAATNAPAVAYLVSTSFNPNPGELWNGNIERQRWTCSGGVPTLQSVDTLKGDDFAANLNSGQGTFARTFYTVQGADLSLGGETFIDSEGNIRPNLQVTEDDGMGVYDGTTVTGDRAALATAMQSNPAAMHMFPLPPACSNPNLNAATAADCAQRVMNWELGGDNGGGLPTRAGDELGAIYHATPAVITPPSALVRDPAYEQFALANQNRPTVLFSATTDGQLHAFKVVANDPSDDTGLDVDAVENNELWSFLPPHVLPNLLGQYPTTQQILLDGTPVVRDVLMADRDLTTARAAGGTWGTVLVAGGRGGGGFYYALDVTNPLSPQFLWQLSHSLDSGVLKPLFGSVTATPAIATVLVDDSGTGAVETAVAILPGGEGTLATGTCPRQDAGPYPHIVNGSFGGYAPRTEVRCWNSSPARSLTIVRLRDGKVLKRFQGAASEGPDNLDATRVAVVDFDSPITSQPVPFPAQPGEIANRIYVGDADGTLWRVNLSDSNPANWEVHLAFDAFNGDVSMGDTAADSQPIALPPVVGLDGFGNTVIIIATGDQESFHQFTAGMKNRVWSITERPVATGTVPFTIEPNWVVTLADGHRVTGPMDLFDEAVFFATFRPSSAANVCQDGDALVWGVDFLDANTLTSPREPMPRLPDGAGGVQLNALQPPGSVVFGVAVTRDPDCFQTASETDEFVGSFNAISAATPGTFKLSFHTGRGGTANAGARTNLASISLPANNVGVRIESWAIVEE